MTSPKVIYNSIFTLALNNPDGKYKNHARAKKRAISMYDYYTNEEKRAISMYDYYTGKLTKEDTMNLIIENGNFADSKEVERRKKLVVKYLENSNLWQGVLSFNNDYINSNIDIHKLERELAINILPKFFKKCGFKDTKKMFYQLALHTDTDNLHFHFSFMEKVPNYIYTKNKIGYRRAGKFSQNEIDFLKAQVIHTIEKEKIYTPLLTKTNKEIDELKKYFRPTEKNFLLYDKKDLFMEEKILKLGKILYDSRLDIDSKIKYGSIKDKEIITLTNEIKRYIFNKDINFKYEYKNFKDSLKKLNNYFKSLYEQNNTLNVSVNSDLVNNKNKYLNNYVCNVIVNHANYIYKKEIRKNSSIKENDVIKEIIFQHYLQNMKQTKKDILKQYFSNTNPSKKYRNKIAIEQAIKNINNEMEDAIKEFSKLFQNDEKTFQV